MKTVPTWLLLAVTGGLCAVYAGVLATFPTSPLAYLASSVWLATGTILAVSAQRRVGLCTWRRACTGVIIFGAIFCVAVRGKWALAVYGFDSERHGVWPHKAVLELLDVLDIVLGAVIFAGLRRLLARLRDLDLAYPFVPPSERPRPPG